jgi:hypothetical protein
MSTDKQVGSDDEGPGWMPAILAGTVLMGIFGFVFCAFSTWVLFQRRSELATRTIQETYLPQLRESYLDPTTRSEVVEIVEQLGADLKGGKYDDPQAAAILQRLQRLPVLQWGELQSVESFYAKQSSADDTKLAEVHGDIGLLQNGVRLSEVTSFDFHEILLPAMVQDAASPTGFKLQEPMTVEAAEEVFKRIKLRVNDLKASQPDAAPVQLSEIVAEAIRAGVSEGGF